MTVYAIGATALTGGGAGALDAEHVRDGDGEIQLHDGDPALVFVQADRVYYYIGDADSGLDESSPEIIKPDWESDGVAYTGDFRWIRTNVYGISGEEFTAALKAKLDGIEALADVTDAENVAAAGAVMSETDPVFSAWDKDYADLANKPPSERRPPRTWERSHLPWGSMTTMSPMPRKPSLGTPAEPIRAIRI